MTETAERVWPTKGGRWGVKQIDRRTGEVCGGTVGHMFGFLHRIDAEVNCVRSAARSVWGKDYDYIVIDLTGKDSDHCPACGQLPTITDERDTPFRALLAHYYTECQER